jgi:hypothetical protein
MNPIFWVNAGWFGWIPLGALKLTRILLKGQLICTFLGLYLT